MRTDLDDEVEVARLAAAARGATLALDADARPVVHPGGDLDRQLFAFLDVAGPAAARAGTPVLPPGAAALRTRRRTANRDRRPGAADGVPEVDLERVLDVLAALFRRAPAPEATAEHLVQDVGEAPLVLRSPPAARAGPEALEVEPGTAGALPKREAVAAVGPAPVLACARRVEAGLETLGAELVVELPLVGVGEDVVREGDVLEPLLRLLVPRVQVGVVLAGELAVGLLDVVGARVPRDTEDGVEILLVRHPRATAARVTRCTVAGPSPRQSPGVP